MAGGGRGNEKKKTRLKVRSSRLVAFTKGPILLFKRIRDETKVGGWNKRDFLLMHLRKGRELEMGDSCMFVYYRRTHEGARCNLRDRPFVSLR